MFVFLVDYWRERDAAQSQYKEQKHNREQILDANSRAMKLLPNKDAPYGGDHCVPLGSLLRLEPSSGAVRKAGKDNCCAKQIQNPMGYKLQSSTVK